MKKRYSTNVARSAGFTFNKIERTKLAVTPNKFITAEAIIKFLLVLFIYIKISPYDSL